MLHKKTTVNSPAGLNYVYGNLYHPQKPGCQTPQNAVLSSSTTSAQEGCSAWWERGEKGRPSLFGVELSGFRQSGLCPSLLLFNHVITLSSCGIMLLLNDGVVGELLLNCVAGVDEATDLPPSNSVGFAFVAYCTRTASPTCNAGGQNHHKTFSFPRRNRMSSSWRASLLR